MANQSVTLFNSITPSSTVASGKRITFPHTSEKAKGCGFYGSSNPTHTVQYSTGGNFVGVIKLQGTLAAAPTEDDWYNIDGTSLGNGVSPVFNQPLLVTFGGKHVWIRSIIESCTAGAINNVVYTHN